MAILNYTTKISHHKTLGEISECLVSHGATKVVTDYDNGIPIKVTFGIDINGNLVGYELPANYRGVLKAMERNKKIPRNMVNEEQAIRVSWRIVKDWIEAQMAIVEADVADLAQVFLPYAVTKNGTTLYQEIQNNPKLLLT